MNTTTSAHPPGPSRSVPRLSGGLPLLGHTLSFLRDLQGLLFRARREGGDVVSIPILGRSIILVSGPEAQEQVFRAPDSVLNPKAAYKMMVPIFGKGVAYDCDDERMQEQLMMLMPALQNKRMRTYGQIITDEVKRSLASWGDQGSIDLYEYMQELTSFTSSHCLLGREFRNEVNDEFARIYHTMERSIVPLAYLNANLPIPLFWQRDKARARLGEMVSEIVEARKQSGYRGEDFLQTLMEATYKDGSSLSDHEITGLLVAAMFAGHHTSAATASWTILELLKHPEWMKAVKEELAEVYAGGREVDYASLRELKKTEWAIKEALRLHPPLFILFRVAMEDTEIQGHPIPKGTWVALSPLVAHQIDEVFKEPASFCPHRYGPPTPEDQRAFAYISFGGGRHKCLGNAFALLQIKTILATLLQQFEFRSVGASVEADMRGLVLGPKAPVLVSYKRTKAATEAASASHDAEATSDTKTEQGAFRIVADLDLCQGHGVCEGDAPALFALENGQVKILQERPDPAFRDKAKTACEYCPQQALSLIEE